jgi:hypothetical protein
MKLQDNERTGLDNSRMIFAPLNAGELTLLSMKMHEGCFAAMLSAPAGGLWHDLCDLVHDIRTAAESLGIVGVP